MVGNGRLVRLSGLRFSPDEVAEKSARIYRAVLGCSEHVRSGNFEAIGIDDLRLLFLLYDDEFFGGFLGAMLAEERAGEIRFRLSGRMTKAAGKTFFRKVKERVGGKFEERPDYEIAISTLLLFQTFRHVDRVVTVAGVVCGDRLESLQRIFEHELLHLAEFLAMGQSSCSAEPFRRLSREIFGHSASVHDLVTPREIADKAHSIRQGDRVSFDHEGISRVGRVNRITKRATVLVEDPAGRPFTDGKKYMTFYVPMQMLRKEP
jgi:hypothetical protein